MQVLRTVDEMIAARQAMSGSVGLVPTMGYLHEGHLSLVRRSTADNDHTVVSIFVNPTQFGPNEDLESYPRDEQRDLARLSDCGPVTVFIPPADEMYPPGFDEWVEMSGPAVETLEGKHRPGHFRGVMTVVARLFRIVRPERAYFGQKDAQQLRIIRRMVEHLGLPVQVVGLPTVREADGLAMSSRNVYLLPPDRRAALAISRALARARDMVKGGEVDSRKIRDAALMTLTAEPRAIIDYVAIVDEFTLEDLEKIDRPALILIAARVGETRLIDNTLLLLPWLEVPLHLQEIAESL